MMHYGSRYASQKKATANSWLIAIDRESKEAHHWLFNIPSMELREYQGMGVIGDRSQEQKEIPLGYAMFHS